MRIKNHRSFTLIEIMVIVTIVSVLAGMVIVNFRTSRVSAHDEERKADLEIVQSAVENYAASHGSQYPQTFNPNNPPAYLNSNTNPTDWVPAIAPDYISVLPKDPINNNDYYYTYGSDGNDYKLEAIMESDGGKQLAAEDGGTSNDLFEIFSGGVFAWGGAASSPSPTAGGNYVLNFDGTDDYLEIADSATLDVDYVTLTAWIYIDPFPEGNTLHDTDMYPYTDEYLIIDKRNENINHFSKKYFSPYKLSLGHFKSSTTTSDSLYFSYTTAGGTLGAGYSVYNLLPFSQWVHIAATYDGTTIKLFINGTKAGERVPVNIGSLYKSSERLFIGKGEESWDNYRYFNGKIDDVRLYNSALPEAAIAEIMNDNESYPENMQLKLDEGSGATASDASGNNNFGALKPDQTNGPQWETGTY